MSLLIAHPNLGLHDEFDRPDTSVPDLGWLDIHDYYPTTGALSNIGTQPSRILSGHLARGTDSGGGRTYGGVWKRWGLTDSYQVETYWDQSTLAQAGPMVAALPLTATTKWGFAFYYNAGFQTWYAVAVGDHSIYDWSRNINQRVSPQTLLAKVKSNKVEVFADSVRILGPVTIPTELQSGDGIGLWHGNATGSDQQYLDRIRARHVPGLTLGSAPTTPVSSAVGSTVKAATASSIDVPYPSGISSGHLLLCYVCKHNSGTMTTPSGWTALISTKLTAAYGIQVFAKIADGTETGNLTISGGSSSNLGAVMERITSAHPSVSNSIGSSGSANSSSSTSITVPSVTNGGVSRLTKAIIGCAANVTLTDPTGFTSRAALGTSGAAVNMSVSDLAVSDPGSSFAAPSGAARATSGSSVGIYLTISPDPR